MEEWAEAGETDFDLPELDADQEYLVGLFFDLGPTRGNGMGEGPTDWDILLPYATAKGLDSDDTAILSDMCKGYHAERQSGENPLTIAPVDRGSGIPLAGCLNSCRCAAR